MFINNCLSGGGSDRVMVLLANEFVNKGYSVDMFIVNPQIEETYVLDERIKRINYMHWDKSGFSYYVDLIKSIHKQLKSEKYNAIISFLVTINVITLISNLGLRNRIIVSERCDPTMLQGG